MKKILCIICIITALFSMCACDKSEENMPVSSGALQPKTVSEADNWQKIIKRNEVKIGVPSLENNFDTELIDAFAKELNIPVTKVLVPDGKNFGELLENGEIDMYWGLYPKEALSSIKYTLSTPYLTSTAAVICFSGKEEEFSKETSSLGAAKDSPEEILAYDKAKNVKIYSSADELLYAHKMGYIEFAVLDKHTFENSKYYNAEVYGFADTQMYNLVIAFKDGYKDVAAETDKTLAKVKASGVASEICEKWYGKDLISN